MPVIRTSGPVSGGNELSSPCVYGCFASAKQVACRRCLDDLAGVHDPDPVGELDEQGQVVRDEEHGEVELPLQGLELLQDLALDDDVERRRRLVEDHELGVEREGHRNDHALPHAPGELVRIRADAVRVDPDHLEQRGRAHERLLLGDALVRLHHVDELVADPQHRVERVHRALKDHRDVAPAVLAKLLAALAEEVLAPEADLAAGHAGGLAQDLQDRVARRALATAGLARKAEDLAGVDLEVDVVDGAHALARDLVVDDELPQLHEQLAFDGGGYGHGIPVEHGHSASCGGSSAGRPPEEAAEDAGRRSRLRRRRGFDSSSIP